MAPLAQKYHKRTTSINHCSKSWKGKLIHQIVLIYKSEGTSTKLEQELVYAKQNVAKFLATEPSKLESHIYLNQLQMYQTELKNTIRVMNARKLAFGY